MPRAFDYTQTDIDIPMRYNNSVSTAAPAINGTWVDYGKTTSSEVKYPLCQTETTDGQILFSDSQYLNNLSCEAHSYNAGNYYNLPSQLGNALNNDICPKGWSLPDKYRKTDYSSFLIIYGIDYKPSKTSPYDAALLNLPLSFLRSGIYYGDGSLGYQGTDGYCRMTSLRLFFNAGNLTPTYSTNANYGYSMRCVAH